MSDDEEDEYIIFGVYVGNEWNHLNTDKWLQNSALMADGCGWGSAWRIQMDSQWNYDDEIGIPFMNIPIADDIEYRLVITL